MNRETIRKKYIGKLLGARNSDDKPNYYVDDFTNPAIFVDFIISTVDHESSFTKDGFRFLEEYYGLGEAIKLIAARYPDYPFDDKMSPKEALLEKKEFALDPDTDRAV